MFTTQPLRYLGTCRYHPGHGTRPGALYTFPDGTIQFRYIRQQLLQSGSDQDEPLGNRSFLESQQVEYSRNVSGITAEAIYRFRWIGNDTAMPDDIGCIFQMPTIYRR
jgi:hypothetical protein